MATKTKKKADKKVVKYKKRKVLASQVRAGDLLVTKALPSGKIIATRPIKSEDISICEGQWRTHIHIGTTCYDERYSYVDIAVVDDRDEEQALADEMGVTVEQLRAMQAEMQMSPGERLLRAVFEGSGA